MNPYHKWLIRQRRYCEHRGCSMKLTPAVKVVEINGKAKVMCAWHGMGQIETGLRERARLEAK